MSVEIPVPQFGRYLDQLKAAGIKTETARGFWGGVNSQQDIIVTAWIDQKRGNKTFAIWKPRTNHGGLKTAWDLDRIHVGAKVRAILVRNQGEPPPDDEPGRKVADAALMPGWWRVVALGQGIEDGYDALIEPTDV